MHHKWTQNFKYVNLTKNKNKELETLTCDRILGIATKKERSGATRKREREEARHKEEKEVTLKTKVWRKGKRLIKS